MIERKEKAAIKKRLIVNKEEWLVNIDADAVQEIHRESKANLMANLL